ncbi:MAG: tRNA 4-thiouridine(8) synthase ThiI [Ignavibacteria bacterium]|nr:tRNA 4-thiouridine(8) synthase ThiI [Ignavibacteria bacterium]MBI3766338.1 tRNA 4-thiouridine(8) synthase ThiI [Ignavibacteriales bacterium]
MEPVIILHHHEIILKGENRYLFERQLLKNVRRILTGLIAPSAVTGGYGRFVIHLQPNDNVEAISQKLSRVFGLAKICTGVKVDQDVALFCEAARSLLEGQTFHAIRVETRRPDKNFPIRSMEVNAHVGKYICDYFHVRADMSHPDETIYITIVDKTAYVYRSKVDGAGGLPSGTSGKVVVLISAGFDSPVAAWKIMKRGASAIFVHFHSLPYTNHRSVDQVKELVQVLTQYQFTSKLYLIPFAGLQNEIVLQAPQSLRVILYRRMMVRIAEAIAGREKAESLVTGEAVGQVASQTLRNIRVIDQVSTFPILRPLSGTDKEETMALARKIGTHDISKEPYDDCCSFLAPRKPETWAAQAEVDNAEAKLDIPRLMQMSLAAMSTEVFSYPCVQQESLVDESAR